MLILLDAVYYMMEKLSKFEGPQHASSRDIMKSEIWDIYLRMGEAQAHGDKDILSVWGFAVNEFGIDPRNMEVHSRATSICGCVGCTSEKGIIAKCSKCKITKYCSAHCQKRFVSFSLSYMGCEINFDNLLFLEIGRCTKRCAAPRPKDVLLLSILIVIKE